MMKCICGNELQSSKYRPRKYCSDACRKRSKRTDKQSKRTDLSSHTSKRTQIESKVSQIDSKRTNKAPEAPNESWLDDYRFCLNVADVAKLVSRKTGVELSECIDTAKEIWAKLNRK